MEAGKSSSTLDRKDSSRPLETKKNNIVVRIQCRICVHQLQGEPFLPVFACIFIIHFFIMKRDGVLSRYSEPSRSL